MNLEHIKDHINAYKEHDQIFDAAHFLIETFGLASENFAGFGFRPELEPNKMLLTTDGAIGEKQMVMIPRTFSISIWIWLQTWLLTKCYTFDKKLLNR